MLANNASRHEPGETDRVDKISQQQSERLSHTIPDSFGGRVMIETKEEGKDRLKKLILKFVRLQNGISDVEIVMKIMSTIGPVMLISDEYHDAYEELIRNREMIVLEFTARDYPSRAKALHFTKETKFSNLLELLNEQKRTNQTNMARAVNTNP